MWPEETPVQKRPNRFSEHHSLMNAECTIQGHRSQCHFKLNSRASQARELLLEAKPKRISAHTACLVLSASLLEMRQRILSMHGEDPDGSTDKGKQQQHIQQTMRLLLSTVESLFRSLAAYSPLELKHMCGAL